MLTDCVNNLFARSLSNEHKQNQSNSLSLQQQFKSGEDMEKKLTILRSGSEILLT